MKTELNPRKVEEFVTYAPVSSYSLLLDKFTEMGFSKSFMCLLITYTEGRLKIKTNNTQPGNFLWVFSFCDMP